MKMLSIIVMLILTASAFAVAPYGLNGQNQSTTYPNVHQVPNKQVTNLGGINALIETGNNNLLENPSFEHATVQTGWTSSAGTIAAESSVVVHGKKSLKISLSSQALDLSQNSTLYQAQFADGVQGLAAIKIKTSITGLRVCPQKAGVINSNLCVNILGDGQWNTYKVPFILGATSNGIEIDSNSVAVTGDVYFDESFVGAVDLEALQSFDTTCDTVACQTVFTATVGSTGSVSLENIDWINGNCSSATDSACTFNSGVFSASPVCVSQMNSNSGAWCYQSPSSSAMTILCRTPAGTAIAVGKTVICQRSGADYTAALTAQKNYEKSKIASFSSTNADTDWQSCGHTTSSFTGFGTVTGIETQCKRQGSDLLMKGKFTTGTITAVEARLSLPIWNGVQLVSKNTTIIPSLQYAGDLVQASNSTTYFRNSILIEPTVSYVTFGIQTSTANSITKTTGSAGFSSNIAASFSARIPIEGWENSNVIIGQFNGLESCASTLECTDTFGVTTSSAAVVLNENVDWINGNPSKPGTGRYVYTYNSNIFTTAPNCLANSTESTGAAEQITCSTTNVTSTTFEVVCKQAATLLDRQHSVICQKQGVDYIGKTAIAVASDQNIRMPGLTKVAIYQASISATDVVTDENADWINGDCTNATTGQSTCTLNANIFSSAPKCWVSKNQTGGANAPISCDFLATPTASTVSNFCKDSGGVAANAAFNLFCMGVTP